MRILLINKFLYPKGGDVISTLATGELLVKKGHEVAFWGMSHPLNPDYLLKDYFVEYVDFNSSGGMKKQVKTAFNMLYSLEAKHKLEKLINKDRPDIAHLHNFAHQISPSILHVLKKNRIPVVMTMHDYKLVCPCYKLLSNEKICDACKNGRYINCFKNKCVKNSKSKSLLNTLEMYLHHKVLKIYDLIDFFISPSVFLKSKLEEMGFKNKIAYVSNFINSVEYEPCYNSEDKSIVYFGRLSNEKGLFTLIEAVKGLEVKLKIIGDGPVKQDLIKKCEELSCKNVEFLGYKKGEELKDEIRKSMFVILPSEWYENNPLSVLESFALGKPIVGARIGGIPELVKDNKTGITFTPFDSDDLALKIKYMLSDEQKIVEMGKNARVLVEQEFNEEKYYKKLIKVYAKAFGFR